MTAPTIMLALVCVSLVVPAALYVRGRLDGRRRVLERHLGGRIAMHLHSGTTLRGVLDRVGPDALEMRAAEHLTPQSTTPLAGAQVIPHTSWDWFQLLPPADQAAKP